MRDGPMLDPKGWWKKPPAMSPQEIIERIMTGHWDMAACHCWVCEAGDELGFGAREQYLRHKDANQEACPVPSREAFMPGKARGIIHGQTCPKVRHAIGAPPTHYSYDDTPFRDWDGVRKCGRCHEELL